MNKQKETRISASLRNCNSNLAGDESHPSNPVVKDFLIVVQKLELLGFTYVKGEVKEAYGL